MIDIKVELLQCTPVETVVAAVAKPYKNSNPSIELVEKIVNVFHHESICEHAVFSFNITGISRGCLQELARHRIASFTVESTRHCLMDLINEYNELWPGHTQEDEEKIFRKYFLYPDEDNKDLFNKLISESVSRMNEYLTILKNDKKVKYTRNQLNDKLKYMIPENLRTTLVLTMNMRSLRNFISLRADKFAHFEIRKLANMIYDLVAETPYKGLLPVIER